ncbi:hypothetical protein DPX16_16092 [Anabarilius grahami]|uniref:Uncharacterized protein n=1 Tax=Anabarilius grahami TaxID=495550 RepID=A0A3N0YP38_ANAGA|nr:hypothetical protein DPX16_16092 [Anabarilius grahami]
MANQRRICASLYLGVCAAALGRSGVLLTLGHQEPIEDTDVCRKQPQSSLRADLSAEKTLTSHTPLSNRQTDDFGLKKSNPLAGEQPV